MASGSIWAQFLTLFPQKVMSKEKSGENREPPGSVISGSHCSYQSLPLSVRGTRKTQGRCWWHSKAHFLVPPVSLFALFSVTAVLYSHMHVRVIMLPVTRQTASRASQKNPGLSTEKELFHRTSLFTDKQSTRSVSANDSSYWILENQNITFEGVKFSEPRVSTTKYTLKENCKNHYTSSES